LLYLQNTNQLTPAVEGKALQYMETGYQQELTYRHSDGSFSAFGSNDPSGSTWLVEQYLNILLLYFYSISVLSANVDPVFIYTWYCHPEWNVSNSEEKKK
jgi:hypothetical protein